MLYAILAYHVEAEVVSWTPQEDAGVMDRLKQAHARVNENGRLGPAVRLGATAAARTGRHHLRGPVRDRGYRHHRAARHDRRSQRPGPAPDHGPDARAHHRAAAHDHGPDDGPADHDRSHPHRVRRRRRVSHRHQRRRPGRRWRGWWRRRRRDRWRRPGRCWLSQRLAEAVLAKTVPAKTVLAKPAAAVAHAWDDV